MTNLDSELNVTTIKQWNLIRDLPIHYAETRRSDPKGLIVLMPSGLAPDREDRERPHFHRFSWAQHWPDHNVLHIADPALQQDRRLNSAWFIHRNHDLIQHTAWLVKNKAREAGIDWSKILFYGSSIGGFAALSCSALVPSSRAVADVPQLDLQNWRAERKLAIEKFILGGESLGDFAQKCGERISIKERFAKSGRIPRFLIVTNPEDDVFQEHLDFYNWAIESDLPSGGAELFITDRIRGHDVFHGAEGLRFIRPEAIY